jgi:nucleoside-diphosphate-sugar epimerase
VILVLGATGKVGRHVVTGLIGRDAGVRALVRNPGAAALPAGVELVRGDLTQPHDLAVDGADAAFLVWPFFSAEGVDLVVDLLAAHVRRLVWPYRSSQAVVHIARSMSGGSGTGSSCESSSQERAGRSALGSWRGSGVAATR